MFIHDLARYVPTPRARDINSGLHSLRNQTLISTLGMPRDSMTSDCRPITNQKLSRQIITADVGPFRVTGLDIAVASLRGVLAKVRHAEPELYRQLGSAGMLCCRWVRGSKKVISNHSWGTAIDLTIAGRLDPPGDGFTQVGLLRLYRFFHEAGWYWGAGFRREDSMHFELAESTFRRLFAEQKK